MKESIKLFCIIIISLLTASYSFSAPLNGTYTIGSGGNYTTINSAYSDAILRGIDGAVIFDLITGIYNEEVMITNIPGSSPVNTVSLRSQTGNPVDAVINGASNVINIYGAANLIFDKLTFESSSSFRVSIYGHSISFTNNNFNNGSIQNYADILEANNISITDNENIANIDFNKRTGLEESNINILRNSIFGLISIKRFSQVRIENNTIGNGINCLYFTGDILKNKITGNVSLATFTTAFLYNNFILGTIYIRFADCTLKHNTIVSGTLIIPTFTMDLTTFKFQNNIFINPEGGRILYSINTRSGSSDHNNYYNNGNNNLISYNGIIYNTINDFYNGTGFDGHSTYSNVSFASPSDLHLSGSSLGDIQLAGIQELLIPDDIDDQIRSVIHPYKGADEVTDFPLPIELASFTSSVNNNNVNLNWTTASETNNSGFDIESRNGRSETQVVWNKIGFINGNGTTTSPNNYEFTDKNLASGKYNYRLKQIDFNGNYEYHNLSDEVVIGVPETYTISQNFPNPFNPDTKIEYSIPNTQYTILRVYNSLGKEVAILVSEIKPAGRYEVTFDGSNLSSGIYFYKIEAGNFSTVKRMILLK